MSSFHQGYHFVSTILQYVWGVIAALAEYVMLPLLVLAFVVAVFAAINNKPQRKETDSE